jgi:hypothetical protein
MATTAPTRPTPKHGDAEALSDARERLLSDRVSQGLPRRVSDPVVVASIAAQLRDVLPALKSSRHKRASR